MNNGVACVKCMPLPWVVCAALLTAVIVLAAGENVVSPDGKACPCKTCPSIACRVPPEGCKYGPPRVNDCGCQVDCGTLICPPKCCPAESEPGKFGNPMCFEGHACCPSTGLWACSIGDGKTFPCGGTDPSCVPCAGSSSLSVATTVLLRMTTLALPPQQSPLCSVALLVVLP